MDLKSSDHQLRLVVYPIIFRVLYIYISQMVGRGISEPSTALPMTDSHGTIVVYLIYLCT